ncbi:MULTISPECIES: ABC transporter permease [Burkholderia]|uniref:ABC transporter membrane protein n=1 Tax=Burkholderia aenigmatica TaxID=2015348 RepID=A0A6J5IUA0_9BURK|nr:MULTISPECIES: ABC transporter permease [Burkholderia]MCA8294835.1 ABC transporter permease [Burkholderia sp. AU30198]CAB3961613.1 ABC transporter membrane protein [Burkholderia aenigmatica]
MFGYATDTQITHAQRLWLYAFCAVVMLFLIVPCAIVVPMSFSNASFLEFPPRVWGFRWYHAYFSSHEWRAATGVSLRVAVSATLAAVIAGTAAAYGLRAIESRWAKRLRTVLMLPMMVPLILVAIGTFFVYVRADLNNTLTGLIIAHTMLALPFVVISVNGGLETYDANQELVARSLGASRLTAFLTVTLPQIRLSIYAAGFFAFMTSFDEVVIALFVSGGENATLTRLMFEDIRDQLDPTITAISTLLISISVISLIALQWVGGRRRARA